MVTVMKAGFFFPSYLAVHRCLPVLVSGRGVRLISSATVKGKGRKRGGEKGVGGVVQTFGVRLVLLTFQHATTKAAPQNITTASSQLGSDAMRDKEGGGGMKRGV